MADIFLSYAREDRDVAERIARALEVCGWTVWWDRHIQAGRRFHQVIERELAAARCVVALWSTAAVASHWVREEAQGGLDRDILVPAKIEEVTAPLGFRTVQAVDLCGWQGAAVDRCMTSLVEDIARLLGGPISTGVMATPSPGANAPPSPTSGRGLAAPATVAPAAVKQEPLPPGEVGATAPGEGAAAPRTADQIPTTPQIHIGVDPRTLPDLAIFKDIDAPWCPEMVIIPAGKFLMGSAESDADAYSDEQPQREVKCGARFAVGRYLLTFAEYDRFCEVARRRRASDEGWGRGRRPVINVSWCDAQDYLAWLCEQTGHRYRLPSEAEWEYACRAGTTTRYAYGETIGHEEGNFAGNVGKTTEVGVYPGNPWGLFDLHGNVWEWVEDVWYDDHSDAPNDCSARSDCEGGESSSDRVVRGGSLDYSSRSCRSACRSRIGPNERGNILGFRLVRMLA